jgi:hypothetical protein
MVQKEMSVPTGTIETLGSRSLGGGFTSKSHRQSSRPGRFAFLNANLALRTGLLPLGPCGTSSFRTPISAIKIAAPLSNLLGSLHRDHFAHSVFLHIAGKAGRHDLASVHNHIGICELVCEIVVLFDQQDS